MTKNKLSKEAVCMFEESRKRITEEEQERFNKFLLGNESVLDLIENTCDHLNSFYDTDLRVQWTDMYEKNQGVVDCHVACLIILNRDKIILKEYLKSSIDIDRQYHINHLFKTITKILFVNGIDNLIRVSNE